MNKLVCSKFFQEYQLFDVCNLIDFKADNLMLTINDLERINMKNLNFVLLLIIPHLEALILYNIIKIKIP